MRFARLLLKAYGPFTGRALEFARRSLHDDAIRNAEAILDFTANDLLWDGCVQTTLQSA